MAALLATSQLAAQLEQITQEASFFREVLASVEARAVKQAQLAPLLAQAGVDQAGQPERRLQREKMLWRGLLQQYEEIINVTRVALEAQAAAAATAELSSQSASGSSGSEEAGAELRTQAASAAQAVLAAQAAPAATLTASVAGSSEEAGGGGRDGGGDSCGGDGDRSGDREGLRLRRAAAGHGGAAVTAGGAAVWAADACTHDREYGHQVPLLRSYEKELAAKKEKKTS